MEPVTFTFLVFLIIFLWTLISRGVPGLFYAARGVTPPWVEVKRAKMALQSPDMNSGRYGFRALGGDLKDIALMKAGKKLAEWKVETTVDWRRVIDDATKRLNPPDSTPPAPAGDAPTEVKPDQPGPPQQPPAVPTAPVPANPPESPVEPPATDSPPDNATAPEDKAENGPDGGGDSPPPAEPGEGEPTEAIPGGADAEGHAALDAQPPANPMTNIIQFPTMAGDSAMTTTENAAAVTGESTSLASAQGYAESMAAEARNGIVSVEQSMAHVRDGGTTDENVFNAFAEATERLEAAAAAFDALGTALAPQDTIKDAYEAGGNTGGKKKWVTGE